MRLVHEQGTAVVCDGRTDQRSAKCVHGIDDVRTHACRDAFKLIVNKRIVGNDLRSQDWRDN